MNGRNDLQPVSNKNYTPPNVNSFFYNGMMYYNQNQNKTKLTEERNIVSYNLGAIIARNNNTLIDHAKVFMYFNKENPYQNLLKKGKKTIVNEIRSTEIYTKAEQSAAKAITNLHAIFYCFQELKSTNRNFITKLKNDYFFIYDDDHFPDTVVALSRSFFTSFSSTQQISSTRKTAVVTATDLYSRIWVITSVHAPGVNLNHKEEGELAKNRTYFQELLNTVEAVTNAHFRVLAGDYNRSITEANNGDPKDNPFILLETRGYTVYSSKQPTNIFVDKESREARSLDFISIKSNDKSSSLQLTDVQTPGKNFDEKGNLLENGDWFSIESGKGGVSDHLPLKASFTEKLPTS